MPLEVTVTFEVLEWQVFTHCATSAESNKVAPNEKVTNYQSKW